MIAPCVALALLLTTHPGLAQADPGPATVRRPHAAYLELFGKGSLWGAGYDYQPSRWLSLGALGSYYVLRGEQVLIFSPYLGLYPLGHGRHRLFAQAGPLLVRKRTPSPVPEWSGKTDTGVAGQLSLGYEYRAALLVRVFGMVTAGRGHVQPWLGISLGFAR